MLELNQDDHFFAQEIQTNPGMKKRNFSPPQGFVQLTADFFDDAALQRDIEKRGFTLPFPYVDWRVRKFLAKTQFPETCNEDTRAQFWEFGGVGVGAELLHMIARFAHAYVTGRVYLNRDLVPKPGEWRYGYPDCPHSWNCYFLQYSGCHEYQVDSQSPIRSTMNLTIGMNVGERIREWVGPECWFTHHVPEEFRKRDPQRDKAWAIMQKNCDHKLLEEIPNGLESATDELMWWHAQLFAYMWQPKPMAIELLESRLNESGVLDHARNHRTPGGPKKSGIIGIHVRRGDKVGHEDVFHPLSKYLMEAEVIRKEHGVHTVYIVSDDMKAVKEEALAFSNWTIIFAQYPEWTTRNDANYGRKMFTKDFGDIWNLSECNFLVGQGTSAYIKIAQHLGIAKGTFLGYRWLDGLDILIGHVRVPKTGWKNFLPR